MEERISDFKEITQSDQVKIKLKGMKKIFVRFGIPLNDQAFAL